MNRLSTNVDPKNGLTCFFLTFNGAFFDDTSGEMNHTDLHSLQINTFRALLTWSVPYGDQAFGSSPSQMCPKVWQLYLDLRQCVGIPDLYYRFFRKCLWTSSYKISSISTSTLGSIDAWSSDRINLQESHNYMTMSNNSYINCWTDLTWSKTTSQLPTEIIHDSV